MDFTNQANQLNTLIQNTINRNMNDLLSEFKKSMPSEVKQIQSEIYASYRVIAQEQIYTVFYSVYGNNFDKESLMNSISFYPMNNFRPDFTYNKKQFKFHLGTFDNIRKFNQNAINCIST